MAGCRLVFSLIEPNWPLPYITVPVPLLRDARPAGWVSCFSLCASTMPRAKQGSKRFNYIVRMINIADLGIIYLSHSPIHDSTVQIQLRLFPIGCALTLRLTVFILTFSYFDPFYPSTPSFIPSLSNQLLRALLVSTESDITHSRVERYHTFSSKNTRNKKKSKIIIGFFKPQKWATLVLSWAIEK